VQSSIIIANANYLQLGGLAMYDAFLDALVDTAKMLPLLFIIYFLIELLQKNYGHGLRTIVQKAGKAGPLLGTFLGCLPQCGFSVICTALYTNRFITLGTLLAVYLATSDEAIPIILSQPDKIDVLFPLLATKITIALIAGYLIDFTYYRMLKIKAGRELAATHEHDWQSGDAVLHAAGNCACTAGRASFFGLCRHALHHTGQVFCFIFLITLFLNIIIFYIGEANLQKLFLGQSVWQPVIAAFVGLVPNCAASVVITELFLKGSIGFGSVIAGLCTSAGLGILVLVKEERNFGSVFLVIALLLTISIVAGITVQFFYY